MLLAACDDNIATTRRMNTPNVHIGRLLLASHIAVVRLATPEPYKYHTNTIQIRALTRIVQSAVGGTTDVNQSAYLLYG